MRRKSFVPAVILAVIMAMAVNAQESTLIIGGQIGQFVPSDDRLQGRGMLFNGSLSGIYGAREVIGSIGYRFNKMEFRFESGIRWHEHRAKYMEYDYTAQLYIFPVVVSVLHRISIPEAKILPFLGIGAGIYISEWQEYYIGHYDILNWIKGDAIHPGYHILAGADYAIGDFSIISELRYSLIYGDWEIRNPRYESSRKISSLNIGGLSLRVGLGYEL